MGRVVCWNRSQEHRYFVASSSSGQHDCQREYRSHERSFPAFATEDFRGFWVIRNKWFRWGASSAAYRGRLHAAWLRKEAPLFVEFLTMLDG